MDAEQSTAALMMLTDIQKKVDDLEKRALTPEQLDAIIGPQDGMQVTLARIEKALAALKKG